MGDANRLTSLLRAGHRCVRIVTHEEPEALDVVTQAALTLDRPLKLWTAVQGLTQWSSVAPGGVSMDDAKGVLRHIASLARAGDPEHSIFVLMDVADHLGDADTLRALREVLLAPRNAGLQLVMIDHTERVPRTVEAHSVRFELSLPDEEELEDLLRATVRKEHRAKPVEVKLTKRDVARIVTNLRGLTRRQATQTVHEAVADDRVLCPEDIPRMIATKRAMVGAGELLEFVEAPTSMDEIGGMSRLKKWLSDRSRSFSKEAEAFGLTPPRGVLLLGVQGAGKSLCAKAVATAWHRPLLRLDPGVLYDRFVGESERRLREALHQIEAMAPAVLWIDEIEKALASSSGSGGGGDGGLSRRMFGTMLTWMQERSAPVFVVATANAIEELPPELMRKGRFDEIFFVDLPGPVARRAILEVHLRRRARDPATLDLSRLVDATRGYSGAEIEQGVVSALHEAFARGVNLSTESLERALVDSPPLSVTMSERINHLRAWASGRCVPADDET